MKNGILVFMIIIISCTGSKIKYELIDENVYDIPIKTQYSARIKVDDDMSNDSISILCNQLFKEAINKRYKYHKEPTHVFIYVYNKREPLTQGLKWRAMISRIQNVDEGVKFSQ